MFFNTNFDPDFKQKKRNKYPLAKKYMETFMNFPVFDGLDPNMLYSGLLKWSNKLLINIQINIFLGPNRKSLVLHLKGKKNVI